MTIAGIHTRNVFTSAPRSIDTLNAVFVADGQATTSYNIRDMDPSSCRMPAVFVSQQGPLGSHTACYETRPSKTENLTGKSLRFVCDRRAHVDCRS